MTDHDRVRRPDGVEKLGQPIDIVADGAATAAARLAVPGQIERVHGGLRQTPQTGRPRQMILARAVDQHHRHAADQSVALQGVVDVFVIEIEIGHD